jgi:hypothetical protein
VALGHGEFCCAISKIRLLTSLSSQKTEYISLLITILYSFILSCFHSFFHFFILSFFHAVRWLMNPQIFEVILDKLNQGGPIVIDNPMVRKMKLLRNE